MFKRIMSIVKRDFKSSVREFILVYIMIAPFILAFGLTFFIPSVESTTMQFAIHTNVEGDFIEYADQFGLVEVFETESAIAKRLSSIDEVIGITSRDGKLEILLYGDERQGAKELSEKMVRAYEDDKKLSEYTFTSLGQTESPVALIGVISLIAMALALGGGIIGLNIIEEKEEGTLRAIQVSPVRQAEFFLGKSLLGALIAMIQIVGILFIVGYGNVHLGQTLMFSFVNLTILVLLGFLIGVLSSNQVMGLANMKFLFLPIAVSILGAVLVPAKWQFSLFWSPFYWSYLGYEGILQKTATWAQLGQYTLYILILFILIFLLSKRYIKKGLTQTS